MSGIPRAAVAAGAAAICALSLPMSVAAPAYARADDQHTRSYDVRAVLDGRGELKITETIAFDFGTTPHHGITREIPTDPASSGGVFVEKGVWARSPDGAPAAANVSRDETTTTIRLGDPNATVTGRHTYELHYVLGGVTSLSSHKRVHIDWNAIGTEWQTPIDKATVRLTAPAKAVRPECFSGAEGSHDSCGHFASHGTTFTDTEKGLRLGEGVTVSGSYPDSKVDADPLTVERSDVAALEDRPTPYPSTAGSSGGEDHDGTNWWATLLGIPLVVGGIIYRIYRAANGLGGWGGGRRWRSGGYYGGGFGGDSFGGGSFGGGGSFDGGGGGDFGGGGGDGGSGGGDGGGGGGSW